MWDFANNIRWSREGGIKKIRAILCQGTSNALSVHIQIRNGFRPLENQSIKWQPTPVFLPGKFYEQRSLGGYSTWGHKESDMTEWLSMHAHDNINYYWCFFPNLQIYWVQHFHSIIRGQGQRPSVPDWDGTGAAERNYPRSEVRACG